MEAPKVVKRLKVFCPLLFCKPSCGLKMAPICKPKTTFSPSLLRSHPFLQTSHPFLKTGGNKNKAAGTN